MILHNDMKKAKIIFFSGTGGTTRVAIAFQKSLELYGKDVIIHELNKRNKFTNDEVDMLIVIYSVHACNAPEPVYEYINAIPEVDKLPAVVISVSGGGEITPNTACRLHCIKRLEKKGFKVVYEDMIVMPSNWIVPTTDGLAIRLLEIFPHKVDQIINDLLSGISRTTKPDYLNRFLSYIGELEKYGTRSFGKNIQVSNSCNGCGWCEKGCPSVNIVLDNGRPHFNNSCLLCLKCIYGCPQKALVPGRYRFLAMEQGYDLDALEKRASSINRGSVEELAKGYLWKGVKDYLLSNQSKKRI